MEEYIVKEIKLKLKYLKSYADEQNGYYIGKVKYPRYLKELSIDAYEDKEYDIEKDEFFNNGKLVVELCGSNRALREFGKYLINLSMYNTKDPNYHDHFDNILDTNGNHSVNLIVRKDKKV